MAATFEQAWVNDVGLPISSGTLDPMGAASMGLEQYLPGGGATAPNLGAPQPIVGSSLGASGSGAVPLSITGTSAGFSTTPAQQASAPSATAPGPASGSLADYFARTIIVILGFIFVAVGLHLLAPSTVPDVRNVVR